MKNDRAEPRPRLMVVMKSLGNEYANSGGVVSK